MKNHACGQLRAWRSRRAGKHAAGRHDRAPAADSQPLSWETTSTDTGFRDIGPVPADSGLDSQYEVTSGEAIATAMQLAIGLLTASLDSPELEASALPTLIPLGADGLGDLMAGLHLISELVIHELHEATGEPPEAILQRLAMLAEHRRGLPSAG